MSLYTDDDVQRGVSDLGLHRCADEWVVRAILDAVLPAYLNRLADEFDRAHEDDNDPWYWSDSSDWLRRKAQD